MHDDLIGELAAAPTVIVDLLDSMPPGADHRPPGDDEWSVAQVIGHIRAADAIWRPRILVAILHDGVAVPDVDERALQDALDAGGLLLEDQVTMFGLERAELVGVLTSLDERRWAHTCIHTTAGAMTVAECVRAFGEHELEHLGQLRTTVAHLQ